MIKERKKVKPNCLASKVTDLIAFRSVGDLKAKLKR